MGRNGGIVAHYEYSPFGSLTASSGEYAGENPFRFSSEYSDVETGLVYYNYRYYSPGLGRWLSRDPIEEQGGYNLYGMVGNNPVIQWDKLGYRRGNPAREIAVKFIVYRRCINRAMARYERDIQACQNVFECPDDLKACLNAAYTLLLLESANCALFLTEGESR